MEDAPRHRVGVRVLQICIALAIVIRISTEARFASFLWGPQGIGTGTPTTALGSFLAPVWRFLFAGEAGTRLVLLVMLLSAGAMMTALATRTATLVLAISFSAIGDRSAYVVDGGDALITMLLFYLVLAIPPRPSAAPGRTAVWLHNLCVVAIAFQAALVYASSGLWKAAGRLWLQGTALYSIGQVAEFSLPGWRWIFSDAVAVVLLTYATVLFQIWFPIAILTRLRVIWLCFGLLLHLGIMLFMGLIGFSLVMIGLDLLLLTDREYARLRLFARRVLPAFPPPLRTRPVKAS
jgi:hypothetical protein